MAIPPAAPASTPSPGGPDVPYVMPANELTVLGHPPGLFLLFLVEMWERFSYYGMRALLVLYLTSPTTGVREPPAGYAKGFNPGPGWSDSDAATLYGWYTGLAYLLPVVGGMVADRLIGTHRSMLVGGLLIMVGHIALAVSGIGSLGHTPAGMSIFIGGLAMIVIGTGHFKPSVSVMVGDLYPRGDPRRDSAFTIFYMGINLGAFLCAFVCGTLGEKVGWHWGFGSAAVGMALGLGLYWFGKPYFLKNIGNPPAESKAVVAPAFLGFGLVLAAMVALAFHYGYFGDLKDAIGGFTSRQPLVALLTGIALFVMSVLAAGIFSFTQRPEDRGPVASIFIFMFFNAFFWLAFEQAGTSINLFTDRYTDLHIAGPQSWEMPASWLQSVNPFFIFLFAPLFGATWTALGRRRMNPSQPMKIAFGLILLGIGFLVLVLGARTIQVQGQGEAQVVLAKAALIYVLGAYFFHTMGELCLSPTGLSYVTKAAPVRFVSLLMGIWFISSFIANLGGGLIAAQTEAIESGKITLWWNFSSGTGTTQADFFFLFVVTSICSGVLIMALTPLLKKLMRDPND